MTSIKFCGMTRDEDVAAACELGVDAIGFVLWSRSPRSVDMTRLRRLVAMMPPHVTPVGVFVSPTSPELADAYEAGIRVAQIHGGLADLRLEELAAHTLQRLELWRARSLDDEESDVTKKMTLVLDAHDPVKHGGTGRTIDWARAATVAATRRVMLAGGLNADNVAEAIRQVRPYGVDVASGIEDRPGIKNAQAMKSFVAAVRKEDE